MIQDEIRQVRRDLLEWAWTKPDQIRFRAVIIVGNLHRLEHWPDDRMMQFEALRNIAGLERALRLAASGHDPSIERSIPLPFVQPPEET